MAALQLLDFAFEARQMLSTPVVGKTVEAQTLQHFRPLFGSAMPGVERHDTPGHQVLAAVDVVAGSAAAAIAAADESDREPAEERSA